MTYEQLIESLTLRLKNDGFESARFEATQIAKAVCGECTSDTLIETKTVSDVGYLLSRRIHHEPLQYVLGEWEFYGLPFKVGRGVLIPRQDTETLVETALPLVKMGHKTVLDLCAGSGCIGITLAKLGDAEVTLVEKSREAMKYLKQNVELNRVSATVVEYDVLGTPPKGAVDMIVSNPPYIRSKVVGTLSPEVKCEPRMALDGGEDGLVFYRAIANNWKSVLKDGGYLLFEIGYDQRDEVVEIMKNAGYSDVTCIKDLCQNPRVVMGRKNG